MAHAFQPAPIQTGAARSSRFSKAGDFRCGEVFLQEHFVRAVLYVQLRACPVGVYGQASLDFRKMFSATKKLLRAGGPLFLRDFPSRYGTLGAPSLRFVQGRARCCLYHVVCHAQRPASHLRRASPALYHVFVLPAIAASGCRAGPRPLPLDSGTDAPRLPFRGRRIRCDAGTHPPSGDGTRNRNSVYGDASVKAALGRCVVAEEKASGPRATQLIPRRGLAASVLAGALLRLQRLDNEEAGREAAVHAPQSGETRIGGVA